jgi:hypothetical protein
MKKFDHASKQRFRPCLDRRQVGGWKDCMDSTRWLYVGPAALMSYAYSSHRRDIMVARRRGAASCMGSGVCVTLTAGSVCMMRSRLQSNRQEWKTKTVMSDDGFVCVRLCVCVSVNNRSGWGQVLALPAVQLAWLLSLSLGAVDTWPQPARQPNASAQPSEGSPHTQVRH